MSALVNKSMESEQRGRNHRRPKLTFRESKELIIYLFILVIVLTTSAPALDMTFFMQFQNTFILMLAGY